MSASNLKAAVTGSKKETPVVAFSNFLEKLKPQMALALPKHMNADRMTRLALTAFSTTPALQECSPQSIAASIMTAAQLGLEPGITGQGYLIPYKKTCTFVPGWKGLVDLVARSGRATVWTGAVREGDEFDYQLGDEPFCRHRPGDNDDGQPFTHVYAIGRVRDSSMAVIEVWSRNKVEKHLKLYNKVGGSHYAKTNENNFEMYARKIALLQVLKYMPASIELSNAVTVANAVESGQNAVIDGNFVTVSEPAYPGSETRDDSASLADQWAKYDQVLAEYGDREAENFMPMEPRPSATSNKKQSSNPPSDDPFAVMSRRIAECKDVDVLDLVVDEIRYLEDADKEKQLYDLAAQRRTELAI